jgi:hypothetical protein
MGGGFLLVVLEAEEAGWAEPAARVSLLGATKCAGIPHARHTGKIQRQGNDGPGNLKQRMAEKWGQKHETLRDWE